MDPIADMLTRIRNAQAVGHPTVSFPYSKMKAGIMAIFEKERLIDSYERKGKSVRKSIVVALKYGKDGTSAIGSLERVSKPGKRIYKKASELYPVRQGFGVMIVSTPEGLLTGKEARKKKLGGEVICKVW
ncbi:30S ribosomal protein S8 [Candidatus Azambacteria bacterium RIFCSPHIGHO2_02_FULL_52_12]|uniref:Small ribosomal subunit protein uS8 n=1 Tax=Candidatus Azambacteria bacterium RIFCSPLOWO2_01_FULL_46_25 TaxID=1797298 RepID=A0A1F5BU40_9BACT|nr:MAG: 30S ribosomal protein S8 [Candidatus Azambacteria bacterium RIFCSPHIGHO2_02_FULL_52_12]OGD34129.1 MAG: 30S ribosomal protein S8 [Candidatus Azambacteria bacterium RIFCSPLOWO2_01_FULL_46_25]OGD36728.1 MAG: 30S ribosomal protein S8 [Candidatus Azambacteria bacterium RIFCSPHIGHO2_01_FULL_51_74]